MSEDTPKYGQSYTYLGGQDMVNEPLAAYALQSKIALIRKGLPLDSLNFFLQKSKLNRQELANILQISPRTMQRYTQGQMLPSPVTEKLLRLNELYQHAEAVLGEGPENITAWLRSEVPALGGQRPLDLLDTYEGLNEVINVLGRLEWGVAS